MPTYVRLNSVLVVANAPLLIEKGEFWFNRNERNIIRARYLNRFWDEHARFLRDGDERTPLKISKELLSLGYEQVKHIGQRGTFTRTGGTITISAINQKDLVSIEFDERRIVAIWSGEKLEAANTQMRKGTLSSFSHGDFVVHEDHGIGRWQGLTVRGNMQYWLLTYAPAHGRTEPDTLLIPLDQEHKISPYIGFRTPQVHRLGTPTWKKIVRASRHDAEAMARELLNTYAKRETASRTPYHIDTHAESLLRASASFPLTNDQEEAVQEVFTDLKQDRPMNRLLVGDVGFGKTEVALSTALQVALCGGQVAILAPTTVLAEQHSETFKERLSTFPLVVERLSRLENPRAAKQTLRRLGEGKIDILIGTHRLLSADVKWKNLKLLIIDEEQRFGVRAKDALKKSRAEIDVLTMSATPLPRTLHLALSSLLPLSQLKNSPPGRIAPRTTIVKYGIDLVREAITRELERSGQVYFLANHIHAMPKLERELKKALPKVICNILHGRLPEETIAKTMHDFREGRVQVLITTTIIENGIDLANANTLIVHDATLLGLAEAHQLRGRIGRGSRESFAYFCYPKHLGRHFDKDPISYIDLFERESPPKALERLDALERAQYLGAGEYIARRDLEMRGAGNILGREQSGTVNQIGLNLYCQLLADAVEKIRAQESPSTGK